MKRLHVPCWICWKIVGGATQYIGAAFVIRLLFTPTYPEKSKEILCVCVFLFFVFPHFSFHDFLFVFTRYTIRPLLWHLLPRSLLRISLRVHTRWRYRGYYIYATRKKEEGGSLCCCCSSRAIELAFVGLRFGPGRWQPTTIVSRSTIRRAGGKAMDRVHIQIQYSAKA